MKIPIGFFRNCSSVVIVVGADTKMVSMARMATGGPFMTPCRSRVVSSQSICQVSGVIAIAELISVLTISLVARLNGLAFLGVRTPSE